MPESCSATNFQSEKTDTSKESQSQRFCFIFIFFNNFKEIGFSHDQKLWEGK